MIRPMEWAVSRPRVPASGKTRYWCPADSECVWFVDGGPDYLNRPARCPDHNAPIGEPRSMA